MSYSQPPGGYDPNQPPGYPPPPPGGEGYGYGYQPAPQTSQKALWSMILGIIGLLLCSFAGIPAIILGRQAKKEIELSQGRLTGSGMATAGFVMGIIAVALLVIGLIIIVAVAVAGGFSTTSGSYGS